MGKAIGILLVIIILAGGFVLFSSDKDEIKDVIDQEDLVTEDSTEVEGSAMVIQDADAVEDMVVEESDDIDSEEKSEVKIFTIDAFNFGYSENEIRVKEGDTVTVNLTNSDGFHDWVVDEFGVATEKIQAGGKASVTFVANKTGTYEYYCSVGSHRANGMVGTLIVE